MHSAARGPAPPEFGQRPADAGAPTPAVDPAEAAEPFARSQGELSHTAELSRAEPKRAGQSWAMSPAAPSPGKPGRPKPSPAKPSRALPSPPSRPAGAVRVAGSRDANHGTPRTRRIVNGRPRRLRTRPTSRREWLPQTLADGNDGLMRGPQPGGLRQHPSIGHTRRPLPLPARHPVLSRRPGRPTVPGRGRRSGRPTGLRTARRSGRRRTDRGRPWDWCSGSAPSSGS
jgi:hypothetical protein